MPVHKAVDVTVRDDRVAAPQEVLELHINIMEDEVAIRGKYESDILLSIDSEGIHLYRHCSAVNGLPLSTKDGVSGFIKVIYE